MSYSMDSSYNYSSGDDSFSFITDPSPYSFCPVHNPPMTPIYPNMCPFHQQFSFYFQAPQQTYQQPVALTPISYSSPLQMRPTKNKRFSAEQVRILEEHFYKVDKYLTKESVDELSMRTQLKPAQIRIWFNNKRTREHR